MSHSYAEDQPAGFKNSITNVAIVGAGGQVGSYMVSDMLKTGKLHITAITRTDSTTPLPEGVKIAKINYDDPVTLVNALKGQDALIITMPSTAPKDTVSKLVSAAAEAKVPFVLPNEWGLDPTQEQMNKDNFLGPPRAEIRNQIESLGKSSWIGVICSFWYEFSFAGAPERYGFDVKNKRVTFFDDGNIPINTTTWAQTGLAVARLLTLPLLPENANDKSVTLSSFKNKFCYVSSFLISQRDMFASVLRATGDRESDWKIDYEDAKERYSRGMKILQEGDRMTGFSLLLYSRIFYPGDEGNYEKRLGTANEALGLPKEDLDEVTRRALRMKEAGEV